jgi:GntR family transcriptional regulator, transcriptional repressor for pyruvate dehydrogenase complex
MAEPGLQPIERSPLYEVVAERLQSFIESENLKPGDRLLPERELAERLGVSRTSVRQALTAMRVMGVIEIRPGAGAYLQRPPADLIPNLAAEVAKAEVDHPMIWEVREGVEVHAARLAARRRDDGDLAAMGEALAAMAGSIDGGGDGVDGDRLFHRAVVAAAHNELLSQLVEGLADVVDRTSEVSLTLPGRAPRSLQVHREILAAIEAGDEEGAAERMQRHIAESAQSVASSATPPRPRPRRRPRGRGGRPRPRRGCRRRSRAGSGRRGSRLWCSRCGGRRGGGA